MFTYTFGNFSNHEFTQASCSPDDACPDHLQHTRQAIRTYRESCPDESAGLVSNLSSDEHENHTDQASGTSPSRSFKSSSSPLSPQEHQVWLAKSSETPLRQSVFWPRTYPRPQTSTSLTSSSLASSRQRCSYSTLHRFCSSSSLERFSTRLLARCTTATSAFLDLVGELFTPSSPTWA